MRDIEKNNTDGRKLLSDKRQLAMDELLALLDIADSNIPDAKIDAIANAFYFGAAVGYRQAQADYKERAGK